MMTLTGNKGKSVVLQSLINSNSSIYAIVYDESPIGTVESLFVSSKHYNILELCESIIRDMRSGNEQKELLVIYTNLKESDTFAIKDMIKELEEDNLCRYGIVMCKE